MKRTALVCTSIGDGKFLDGYCQEIEYSGVRDQVEIIVIADRKTPLELWHMCSDLRLGPSRPNGPLITCPTVSQQDDFLVKVGMDGIVPYNSDNRRNIGYLMALERGCEVVISIDDDNYRIPGQYFFERHTDIGRVVKLQERECGWYNVCRNNLGIETYPRGFPYYARKGTAGVMTEGVERCIAVNQGLWIGDPDIDALTWVADPKMKVGWQISHEGNLKAFQIGPKTWMPINSQNTAVWSQAMPAYYFIPMGGVINGWDMDRMGDIFQGYFLEACVKHMGHGISVGLPLVHHVRNSHNHLADLFKELPGIAILENILPWLTELKLVGHSYEEAYACLAEELDYIVEQPRIEMDTRARAYFHRVTYCMRQWLKACKIVS